MSTRTLAPAPGSTFIAIDADDARSAGSASVDEVTTLIDAVRSRYVTAPTDQVWIGSRRRLAEELCFAASSPQTHFVLGPDDAGGRAALIQKLDVPWLSTRFERLVIVSGRPSWVRVAREARAHGMPVHLVHGPRPVPEVLRDLADEVVSFRFTEMSPGSAA